MDISVNGLIADSKRRVGGIESGLMAIMEELIRRCHARGVHVIFTQGKRTLVEQAKLFGQGRVTYKYNGVDYGNPKLPVVTQATPGSSIHNYGIALDFAIVKNGKDIIWDTTADLDHDGKADWVEVVEEAKKLGFEWGGDWTSFRDFPHLEFTGNLTYKQIFAGQKPTFPKVQKDYSKTFYTVKPAYVKTKVDVTVYKDVEFKTKAQSKKIPKGSIVKVTGLKHSKAGCPRLQIDGGLISSNKNNVLQVSTMFFTEKVDKIKTKTAITLYQDAEFNKPLKKEKIGKGEIVKVIGITHSKNGTPRFITCEGLVTANKNYVVEVKSSVAKKFHTVVKGDTLSKIAKANKTTVAELKKLNNLKGDLIQIGQKLELPV